MKQQESIIETAKAETQGVYERQALVWDQQRPRSLYEKPWLDRFLACVPATGRLLDLGCGAGDPIGRYFLDSGFKLVGIDYSTAMIELARARHRQAEWLVQDMRSLDLDGTFDGICSWDGFFHLAIEEQRTAIPEMARYVRSGGAMLLTVGPVEGEVTGKVGGETVYHASLSPNEYRRILSASGFQKFQFVPEDQHAHSRSVLLASERAENS